MSGNGSKRDYTLIATSVFATVLIVAVLVLNKEFFRPEITATPEDMTDSTPTPTTTSTSTSMYISAHTPTLKFIITPTSIFLAYTSTPFIPAVAPGITNGPPRFGIESWDDDSSECSLTVIIYGVIVSHGVSPYTFTFWSQKEPFTSQVADIKQVIIHTNFREYVEFMPPIVVAKGRYKHVELTFQRTDGKRVTWIDDLFYPLPNGSCH